MLTMAGLFPDRACMCIPMFTAALFTIANIWKQPKCAPGDKWIKKKWYICNMEYHSANKKFTICNNVDRPRRYYKYIT